ncbi:hypothetical protein P5673_022222 [Acropora cervicornis]|uniref:Uncharacterized protein n=1 Tax=Acropora cervicornis TaxID=6130 RepID=A0AAD9Q7B8_ACRCE|nr:hypothetical protein P5673_022222 [Acropora cervicornis]
MKDPGDEVDDGVLPVLYLAEIHTLTPMYKCCCARCASEQFAIGILTFVLISGGQPGIDALIEAWHLGHEELSNGILKQVRRSDRGNAPKKVLTALLSTRTDVDALLDDIVAKEPLITPSKMEQVGVDWSVEGCLWVTAPVNAWSLS